MDSYKYMFYEIMQRKQDKTDETLVLSLNKMYKFCKNIELLMDKSFQPYYRVSSELLLNQNIDISDLLELNESGWVLNENKDFIEFYIN